MKSLAKFVGAALVGALALLAAPAAQAQVGVSINIGTPGWGPQVPYGTQYYYIPEIDGYYDLYTQQYIVFQDGYWVPLPQLYGYDPYQFHPVIVDYRGAQPWLRVDYYRQRYAYQPYRNYGPSRSGYYNGGYYGRPRYDNRGYSNGRGYGGDRDRDNRGYGGDRDHDNRGYGGDRDRDNRGYGGDRDRENRPQSPGNYNNPRGNQGQPQAPQPQPQPQPGRGGDRGSFGPGRNDQGQPGGGRGESGGRGNNGNGGGRGNGNSRSRD